MKPKIKIINRDSNSVIASSYQSKQLAEIVDKELSNKYYSKLIESPLQLYLTLVVNPADEELNDSYKQRDYVFIKSSSELEGDSDIYALNLCLSKLSFPKEIGNILIVVGTKEYALNKVNNNSEDSSKIKYEAVEPNWSLDEIVLTNDVRKKLERATKIIVNKDVIFNTLGYSRADKTIKSIICFYGPAGTGKTITAQAIAKHLKKKIVFSSYAQIESKYVGDGAKNLRKIFQDAEAQDAVLFMDECDSFLSKRIESTDSGSDKHYNRMSNELFQLLENHTGCIIFATNLLTDIDKAFKSRIIDSIYFPLPDKEGRAKILKKMCLPEILNNVFKTDKDLDEFAEHLGGFSGRDMRKSLLLSYAEVSDDVVNVGFDRYVWSLDKFRCGFDDVKNSFSESTEDSSLPVNNVQSFIDNKRFSKKQFEIAKHAVLIDDGIDDREFLLMKDLSKQLMNVELQDRNIKVDMTLPEICKDITDVTQKRTLVDIAIRVVAIDGEFSDNEKIFVKKVSKLLEFSEKETESFITYGESMANAYLQWIKAIEA